MQNNDSKLLHSFLLYFVFLAAPCPNSLLYLYPEDLTANNDGANGTCIFYFKNKLYFSKILLDVTTFFYTIYISGVMYLMTDFVFASPTCSRITSWEFSYSKSGWIDFMVWRPSGDKYKLIAYNTIYVDGKRLNFLYSNYNISTCMSL
jgi:hypothetical protein